jgi:hypothetical protein
MSSSDNLDSWLNECNKNLAQYLPHGPDLLGIEKILALNSNSALMLAKSFAPICAQASSNFGNSSTDLGLNNNSQGRSTACPSYAIELFAQTVALGRALSIKRSVVDTPKLGFVVKISKFEFSVQTLFLSEGLLIEANWQESFQTALTAHCRLLNGTNCLVEGDLLLMEGGE